MSVGRQSAAALRWSDDVDLLSQACYQFLTNDYDQAEDILTLGLSKSAPPVSKAKASSLKPSTRDLRPAFALLKALLLTAKSAASFDDTAVYLQQAMSLLLQADSLARDSEEWIGKSGVRGLCLFFIGILEIYQKSYMKGMINVSRAMQMINTFAQALKASNITLNIAKVMHPDINAENQGENETESIPIPTALGTANNAIKIRSNVDSNIPKAKMSNVTVKSIMSKNSNSESRASSVALPSTPVRTVSKVTVSSFNSLDLNQAITISRGQGNKSEKVMTVSSVMRSTVQFCLGVLNLFYAFLPPASVRIAKWFTGFDGKESEGAAMLWACFAEKGIFAPLAGLVYGIFHVDMKASVGEEVGARTVARIDEIISWGKGIYPNSAPFLYLEVQFLSITRKQQEALNLLIDCESNHVFNLPAFKAGVKFNEASLRWSMMDFEAAGECQKSAVDIMLECDSTSKSRSNIPFTAALSFLSFLQHLQELQAKDDPAVLTLEDEKAAAVEQINDLIEIATDCMEKKKIYEWSKDDRSGFDLFETYATSISSGASSVGTSPMEVEGEYFANGWILLDIAELMVLKLGTTSRMSSQFIHILMNQLKNEREERDEGFARGENCEVSHLHCVRMCVIFADLYSQLGEDESAANVAVEGLRYEAIAMSNWKSSVRREFNPYFAVLSYYLSRLACEKCEFEEAQDYLNKVKSYGTFHKFSNFLYFRKLSLQRKIDQELQGVFEELLVPAWSSKKIIIDLSIPTNKEIMMDSADQVLFYQWMVDSRTVSFQINAIVNGHSSILRKVDRQNTEGEMFSGELEEIPEDARLEFIFDNTHSFLNSKTIKFAFAPAELKFSIV